MMCCNLYSLAAATFVAIFKWIHRLCAGKETSTVSQSVSQVTHQTV